MTLTTSQSLPPSTASSVMIMRQSIDLAGLAHRKNSLTLHCFLTWNSNQNDKISPPSPPPRLAQNKSASHPQLGLRLGSLPTPSKTASPLFCFFFFSATLAWIRAIPVFKRTLRGHLGKLAKVFCSWTIFEARSSTVRTNPPYSPAWIWTSLKNCETTENLPTALWMAVASGNPLYIQRP